VTGRLIRHDHFRVARLAAISAFAKGPGFLIPIVLAAFFGASRTTDEYFLAYAALLFVGGSIGQALEAAVVPFAATAMQQGSAFARRRLETFARGAGQVGGWGAVIGAVVLWAGMSVTDMGAASRQNAVLHFALLAPACVAWAVSGVYSGALVSALRLERSAAANAFRGGGALVGAGFAGATGVLYLLPLGLSVGEVARAAWLRHSWKAVTQDHPPLSVRADNGGVDSLGTFRRAATAQVAAQGMLAATPLIERLIAGSIVVAGVSRLEYGYRLLMVCAVLFDGGIAPWLLARWSRQRATRGFGARWDEVGGTLLTAAAISGIMAATFAVLAPAVVQILLMHGRFTEADGIVVTSLIRWYTVGFAANMIALCAERALLATARNRRFFELGVIRAVTRVVIVLLLTERFGLYVFPLAYAISEGAYLIVVMLQFRVPRLPPELTRSAS
jgi:putative peptidoglycan lipid II flippase